MNDFIQMSLGLISCRYKQCVKFKISFGTFCFFVTDPNRVRSAEVIVEWKTEQGGGVDKYYVGYDESDKWVGSLCHPAEVTLTLELI